MGIAYKDREFSDNDIRSIIEQRGIKCDANMKIAPYRLRYTTLVNKGSETNCYEFTVSFHSYVFPKTIDIYEEDILIFKRNKSINILL